MVEPLRLGDRFGGGLGVDGIGGWDRNLKGGPDLRARVIEFSFRHVEHEALIENRTGDVCPMNHCM